jgi:hypothetical protein
MTDEASGDAVVANRPIAPQLRQGPGAFAWISLGLLILAAAALGYAFLVGAYGSALVSLFAVLALSLPTLILMAVWIEVHVDNRRAIKRYEAQIANSADLQGPAPTNR